MPGILIFVPLTNEPATKRNGVAILNALGLGVYHDQSLEVCVDTITGPLDQRGAVFSWREGKDPRNSFRQMPSVSPQPMYHPRLQAWHPCAADGDLPAGRAWIGWDLSHPPTSQDLARPANLRERYGKPITLNDGDAWILPTAQLLPQKPVLKPDGDVVGIVADKYQALYEAAYQSPQWFDESGAVKVDVDTLLDFAIMALSVHYRIGRDLALRLELLTTEHLTLIPQIVAEFDKLSKIAAAIA